MARTPATPAIRALRDVGIEPEVHPYRYAGGGAAGAAEALGIEPHVVIKTLVFLADDDPVLVLMHGDREVSSRAVARTLGAKRADPAPVDVVEPLAVPLPVSGAIGVETTPGVFSPATVSVGSGSVGVSGGLVGVGGMVVGVDVDGGGGGGGVRVFFRFTVELSPGPGVTT